MNAVAPVATATLPAMVQAAADSLGRPEQSGSASRIETMANGKKKPRQPGKADGAWKVGSRLSALVDLALLRAEG